MVLDVRRAGHLRAARDANSVWRGITTDEAWAVEGWVHDVTGRSVTLAYNEDPDDWAIVAPVVETLEPAASATNVLLCQIEVRDQPHKALLELSEHMKELRRTLPDVDARLYLISTFLHELWWSSARVWSGDESGGEPTAGTTLVGVRLEEPYRPQWSEAQFDVFISYRHRAYEHEAHRLHQLLSEAGLRCWLDVQDLALRGDEKIDQRLLRGRLQEAIAASACTALFAIEAEGVEGEDERGANVAFSWSDFERRHSRVLVALHPRLRLLIHDGGRQKRWENDAELTALVEETARTARDRGVDRGDAEVDLGAAVHELHRQAGSTSTARPCTPLASLALLAPQWFDSWGHRRPVTNEDVLTALVRYDPSATLALREAGVDSVALHAAAARWQTTRWSEPGPRRWDDVFDLFAGSQPKPALPVNEEALLAQVIDNLSHSPATPLVRAAKLSASSDEEDEHLALLARVRHQAHERAASTTCRHGRHGWLVIREGGRVRPVPVVHVRSIAIDGERWFLPERFGIWMQQSDRLFPVDAVEGLEAVLNSDDIEGGLSSVLTERPEVALTLDGAVRPCRVHHVPRSPVDRFESVLIDLAETATGSCAVGPEPVTELAELAEAIAALAAGESPASPPPLWPTTPLRSSEALLVAPACSHPVVRRRASALDTLVEDLGPVLEVSRTLALPYDDLPSEVKRRLS
ncbi:toll/interleukin-1 receptor domain-containing protein [Actinomycetospora aeridis]|uniref:Toll/interleukin-1 receptor domain-containing protein n=1 Tax=Actinomycetospora aeridis TaxID=3129231 RepID=A0ABU8NER5_9PSEU